MIPHDLTICPTTRVTAWHLSLAAESKLCTSVNANGANHCHFSLTSELVTSGCDTSPNQSRLGSSGQLSTRLDIPGI